MIGSLISLIFRGSSIMRRNNFPRIENVTETENLAMVLHTALLMHYLLSEKLKMQTDLNFIFKKIMFSSFITFTLSDINSQVKRAIIKKNNLIYAKLELSVYNILLGLELPQELKKDINGLLQSDNTLFGDKFRFENDLISFCKLIVAQNEAQNNAIIYPDSYEKPLESIKERLSDAKYEVFNKVLDRNIKKYLNNIRKLQFCMRRNRMRRKYPISVLSHLYICFCLSYFIGVLEGKKNEEILDMMQKSLYHDVPETVTGDILTYTKNSVQGLKELVEEIEEEAMIEQMFVFIKKYKFSKKFQEFALHPMDGEVGKLVKISDKFSALFEAKLESEGDQNFSEKFLMLRRQLNKEKYKSVEYILKFGVDYFDEDISENILNKNNLLI